MNLIYIIGIASSLLFISPPEKKEGMMLVAQFNLYVDGTALQDGDIIITWEDKIDRNFYEDDCQALYDLSRFMGEICSEEELRRISELLNIYNQKYQPKELKKDENINRL